MSRIELSQDEVVYYVAQSLDGYIADADGKTDWRNPYLIPELGFHDFLAQVRCVLIGRRTYDFIESYGKWPYGEIPGVVATHRPPGALAGPIAFASGSPADLVAAARAAGPGPCWVAGGAELAGSLLAAGVVTRLDIFIIPTILGGGMSAFRADGGTGLGLIESARYVNGVARLSYRTSP